MHGRHHLLPLPKTVKNVGPLSLWRHARTPPHPATPKNRQKREIFVSLETCTDATTSCHSKKPSKTWDLCLTGDMHGRHHLLPLQKTVKKVGPVSLWTHAHQVLQRTSGTATGHERDSIWTTRDKREAASTPSRPQRTSGTQRSGTLSGHRRDAFGATREKRTGAKRKDTVDGVTGGHRSVRSVCACARVCVRTSPRAPLHVCTWARVCGCVRVSS